MSQYHKIQTVYKRDPDNNYRTLLEGEWAKPEFGYLAGLEWMWTEKVDGTNMRVIYTRGDGPHLSFGGKTDRAQIPAPLANHMAQEFSVEHLADVFGEKDAVLYGEGYGGKIQKAGATYGGEQRFVLFDAFVNGTWLERGTLELLAEDLNVPLVPVVGRGGLPQMVEAVRSGLPSKWGAFDAEGIVARPAIELVNRFGERVITKLKHKDFPKEETP